MGRRRAESSPSNRTGPSREAGHRRDEAHDVAGQPAVDLATADEGARGDQPVAVVDVLDIGAEGTQRPGHEQGVTGAQRRPEARDVVGEGGEDEVAVGERLAAREDDAGVDRARWPSAPPSQPMACCAWTAFSLASRAAACAAWRASRRVVRAAREALSPTSLAR